MPIKKFKKKIRYKDNQKFTYGLDLLNSRALISLSNYLDDKKIDDNAHQSMEQLFRDYKRYKKEVHKALVVAFKFLIKDRYLPDPDDPPYYVLPKGPPPGKKRIKRTKKYINQIARKIWKS